jgi:hypothetical protein
MSAINAEFARALGLPLGTTKATLYLEAGKVPRMDIECHVLGANGQLERTPDCQSLRSIAFSYRLVPFGERP